MLYILLLACYSHIEALHNPNAFLDIPVGENRRIPKDECAAYKGSLVFGVES